MLKFATYLLVWLTRIGTVAMIAAVFTTASSNTWGNMREWFYEHPDKALHFIGMFFITFVALIAVPKAPTIWIWVSAIGLAGAVELIQISGPRSADWMDFLCSAAGVLTIMVAYYCPKLRAHFANYTGK